MKGLGTFMIVIGVLMMITFVFLIPGAIVTGVGALVRMSARSRGSAGEIS